MGNLGQRDGRDEGEGERRNWKWGEWLEDEAECRVWGKVGVGEAKRRG